MFVRILSIYPGPRSNPVFLFVFLRSWDCGFTLLDCPSLSARTRFGGGFFAVRWMMLAVHNSLGIDGFTL